jgi:hypothetical protein
VGRFSFGHFSQTPRAVPRCRILHGLGASFPAFRTKISFALQAGFGPIAFAGAWDVLRHGVLRPPDQHAGQNHSRDRQQRGPEREYDHAPPRRPVVDAIVGGSLRVRDPAPTSRCFQSQSVPHSPPHARSSREAFLERRDSEADSDHEKIQLARNSRPEFWPRLPGLPGWRLDSQAPCSQDSLRLVTPCRPPVRPRNQFPGGIGAEFVGLG